MKYRTLGKTGLEVSEIGFGGEWLERHPEEESVELIRYASSKGINILDCWMPDPKSRDMILYMDIMNIRSTASSVTLAVM